MARHTAQAQISLTPKGVGLILLLAALWGFSFLAIHVALEELGPLTVVAHRLVWAAVTLWLYLAVRGIAMPRRLSDWGAFIVAGVFANALPFFFIAWGQQHIESGLASILNASTAIWGVLLAALLLPDERLSWRKAVGVALGFLGVVVAVGAEALSRLDLRSLSQLGIFAGTFCYGISGVWIRRRLGHLPPEVAVTGMLTASSAMIVPVALWVEGPIQLSLAWQTWAAIAYVAVPATAIAYIVLYRAIALVGSGNSLVVTLLVAPIAIVAGAVFLGEALPLRTFAGFALLALGLAVLDGRLLQLIRSRSRNRDKKPLAPSVPPG